MRRISIMKMTKPTTMKTTMSRATTAAKIATVMKKTRKKASIVKMMTTKTATILTAAMKTRKKATIVVMMMRKMIAKKTHISTIINGATPFRSGAKLVVSNLMKTFRQEVDHGEEN